MYLNSEEQLRELYGFAKGRAKDKLLPRLERHSRHFISLSPFMLLSTHNLQGEVDCSPRGGEPGFVAILNDECLLIPDAKGNNRLDSLVNMLATGKVGCLFLIPGVDETLRVNGNARLSVAPEHLALFGMPRNPPKSCIEIRITEVFLHCAKALMRSKLWAPESRVERSVLPGMSTMLNDQLNIEGEAEPQEAMIARYRQDL
jgi:PPOX class probable FMN-dependent enzyme